jgi:hypothetical protein
VLDLQSGRHFRKGDGVTDHRKLLPGGGPAAAFDPTLRDRAASLAHDWLATSRGDRPPLGASPAVAWIALASELSLFDLDDIPDALPPAYSDALKTRLASLKTASTRAGWRALESEQWSALAASLREAGIIAPLAGSSHWLRQPEFVAAQTAPGLDLIDDRFYWSPPAWVGPERRSLLWESGGGLFDAVAHKRRDDRPYVLGDWGVHTSGTWDTPYAAAEILLVSELARAGDWDAVIHRGLGSSPTVWGSTVPGTGIGPDSRPIPLAVNANPTVFAMLPHAASIVLRGGPHPAGGAAARRPRGLAPGWVQVDTPFTKALAGWPLGRKPFAAGPIRLELRSDFGALAVSSVGAEPIDKSRRLLVTAVARAQPTGLAYADGWQRETGIRGQSPILIEPVSGSIEWTHPGRVEAHALDAAGHRTAAVPLHSTPDGRHRLDLGQPPATLHYELIATD